MKNCRWWSCWQRKKIIAFLEFIWLNAGHARDVPVYEMYPSYVKRVELALQDLAAGVFTSVKGAAKAHSAPESTVCGRWKGGKSQAEGNEWQQLLSANEERALVKWITELTFNGFPPRAQTIREMAEEIRR